MRALVVLLLLLIGAAATALARAWRRARSRARQPKNTHVKPPAEVTLSEALSASAWDSTRPLGVELSSLPAGVAAEQLTKLREARAISQHVEAVMAVSLDKIEITVSPDAHSQFELSLAFVGDRELYFSESGRGFPVALLPCLTLIREVDLVLAALPRLMRAQIEQLAVVHAFAPNDLLYGVRVRGFGPIPGIDDYGNATLFDVADVPEGFGSVLVYADNPPRNAATFRRQPLSQPPRGFHRTHGLSVVGQLGASRVTAGPYGRIDFAVTGKVHLPVSRWLLPKPLIRWFVSLVLRLMLPLMVRLNVRFEGSALHRRVQEDLDGFYAGFARRSWRQRT